MDLNDIDELADEILQSLQDYSQSLYTYEKEATERIKKILIDTLSQKVL